MGVGSFVLMLHSHLPYYRKAGLWPFGEENLYECMAETYLPLLNMLNDLQDQGIRAKITLGITPILAEQLADSYLQEGFTRYLASRIEAAEADMARYPDSGVPHSEHLAFLARYYRDWFQKIREDFTVRYDRNLLAGFRALQDAGAIEITTSGATHGFSPLLGEEASINAQFRVGVETYQRHFGKAPRGCWLPECAYRPPHEWGDIQTGRKRTRPGTEAYLYENGLGYFFTESQAIEGAASTEARRRFGIYDRIEYVPAQHHSPTGLSTFEAYWLKDYPVAVMGRNNRASFQVWSAAHGYPGDGLYREFHRKDANSGLHYWRLTSKDHDLGDKMLYDPVLALSQVESQAEHFTTLCYHLLKDYRDQTGEEGLLMVAFDTELYGHWWFEGIAWLKAVLEGFHRMNGVAVRTAGEYLEASPPQRAITLPESTWGQGGHYWVWSNPNTDWMWPILHRAEARMKTLVDAHADGADPLTTRALNQVLRELLLLQGSDWPFLVTTFQAKDYAVERFNTHARRFNDLADSVERGSIDEGALATIEAQDNPFPNLQYPWYQAPQKAPVLAPAQVGGL